MIAYLKGKLKALDFQEIMILTSGGVGYSVVINELIYSNLILDQEIEMHVYHHRTENSEMLFGFLELDEKEVFSELIKISGVGGKVAMQILSLGIHRLISAVHSEDNRTIESIKGIGKKMAEKIILELKDKEFKIDIDLSTGDSKSKITIPKDLFESITDTLVAMGYQPKHIEKALSNLPEEMEEAGDIIPYVIKELS